MTVALTQDDIQGLANDLCQRFPEIQAVLLFGSQATGPLHPRSDIDLAVLRGPEPSNPCQPTWLDDLIQYRLYAGERMGTSGVDVTILNDAPAWLQREILVTGQLLQERQPLLLAQFKESWLKRHGDLYYRRTEYQHELQQALRTRYVERQRMSPIDRAKVEARLGYIRRVCRELERELAVLAEEEFCSRWIFYAGITHLLQTAVEAMIDVINHIISRQGFAYSDEHGQNVLTLVREGIFSPTMAERYRKMIGFRNLVVHLYQELDPHQVYGIAVTERSDFEAFIGEVMSYLDSLETPKR